MDAFIWNYWRTGEPVEHPASVKTQWSLSLFVVLYSNTFHLRNSGRALMNSIIRRIAEGADGSLWSPHVFHTQIAVGGLSGRLALSASTCDQSLCTATMSSWFCQHECLCEQPASAISNLRRAEIHSIISGPRLFAYGNSSRDRVTYCQRLVILSPPVIHTPPTVSWSK